MTYRSPQSTQADLRSHDGWSRWVSALSEVDARLLALAAMEYRAEHDSIHLIFGWGDFESVGSSEVARQVADLVQAFYAERRLRWLDNLSSEIASVPRDMVMPRLEIEVTPPCRRPH
jgi:hypothetical protein